MTVVESTDQDIRRVVMIDPVSELGGAERVLLDLIASAKAKEPGIAFYVILFADGPLAASVARVGGTPVVVPLPKKLQVIGDSALGGEARWSRGLRALWALILAFPELIAFVRLLRAQIEQSAPDLIHTNGMKAHLLSWLVTPRRVPLVWHMHDFLSARPFARQVLKRLVGRVSAVIAISDAVARDVRPILPSARVVTIANAIDTSEFAPGVGDGVWLDQLAGFGSSPAGARRIGLIATYARWKGQDVFLRAAAQLRSRYPLEPLRFYLIGGPIYSTDSSQFTCTELTMLIDSLGLAGSAGLIPFQRELAPILRSLDIVVHASSRPEPFGRTILEAMACGCTVVASAGGGADEISENGMTALTHPPGDAVSLAEQLAILIDDPDLCARLGRQARQAAVSGFSRDRLGPTLLALYRSIGVNRWRSA